MLQKVARREKMKEFRRATGLPLPVCHLAAKIALRHGWEAFSMEDSAGDSATRAALRKAFSRDVHYCCGPDFPCRESYHTLSGPKGSVDLGF